MKLKFNLFILLFTVILNPFTGFSQTGTLDATYGNNGTVLLDPSSSHDSSSDMFTQDDTTTIITGTMLETSGTVSFLIRVLQDGTQDMSFGTNGIITLQFGIDTYAKKMILQNDGKIIVAGLTYISGINSEFFIARFNPDFTPDLTFNSTGHFLTSYSSNEDNLQAVTIQSDGKYVLAGNTINSSSNELLFTRVNANGTLDVTFGTNGYTHINASTQGEEINAVQVMNDGTIIGFGHGYQSSPYFGELVYMAKLTSAGIPVSGFGTNGVLVPPVFNDISTAWDCIAVNDSLYVTGFMYDASNNMDLFIAKLDAQGNVFSGFGTNGITLLSLNPFTVGLRISKMEDDKFYISGTTGLSGPSNRDFLLVRVMPDGTLDPSFNNIGYVTTDIQPAWDEAYGLGMQPDGKIVMAGMSSGFPSQPNFIGMARYLNDFVPSGCYANFSADNELTCEGAQVHFTDLTVSTDSVVLTWNWTFEGGTPATSTAQNPTVVYNNDGTYDVQLIVYDGIYTDTLLMENYITVESIPSQPVMPTGPTELCGGYNGAYTTSATTYADTYNWRVVPAAAGTISGTGLTGTFTASTTWTGTCDIQVQGVGYCGSSPWSEAATCEVHHDPILFQLLGDGGYCEGSPGAELVMDGSETGVDYELYIDGSPTGNIVPGTGSSISFGFYTTAGLYTVAGYTDFCFEEMIGQVYVHQLALPSMPGMINGPDNTCDNETSVYTVPEIDDAQVYVWTLDPATAGEMTTVSDTATIAWNEGFSGTANLSVHGENICGEGPESNPFIISVHLAAHPAISGPQQVCSDHQEDYLTEDHPGSIYTWTVTGGIVTAGPGTHKVTIQWGDPGVGSVTVMEETADGCSTTTEPYDVTVDECNFTGENSRESAKIYPNPVKDVLNVTLPGISAGNTTISIVNTYGLVLETIPVNSGNATLQVNMSAYPAGVYFLKLEEDGNGVSTARFVVIK